MTSIDTTLTSTTNTLKKRVRPGLKLNVGQKAFEEQTIQVNRNSEASYVVQNHPRFTDQSEFSYSTQKKYDQIFFNDSLATTVFEDISYSGDSFYVTQKANGKEMQDRYKASRHSTHKDLQFFGVYDGHTTHVIAELIANKLDQYVISHLKNDEHIPSAIKKSFAALEDEVMTSLSSHRPRGGSTVLCSILHGRKIYSGNVGDCQAVVYRNRSFLELTSLHDFNNEQERIAVEKRGGTILKNRLEGELALSRSIGDINFKAYMSSEPEISEYEITDDDDFLLLASDGFWNGVSPHTCLEKIEEFRGTGNSNVDLKELGDFLVQEARRSVKTKKDNMTLIVVDLKSYLQRKKETSFSMFF